MRSLVLGVALCCLSAVATYASETCGIGTAIRRLKFVEHPLSSDFDVPSRVILQEAEGTPPFHFCDDQIDLKPGIAFMNKYVDKLVSAGASEDEPDIIAMRLTVAAMTTQSGQRRLNKKSKKKQLQPLSAPANS